MLDHEECGFEDFGRDHLDFDAVGQWRAWVGKTHNFGVNFPQGLRQLASNRKPFGSVEAIMLEKENEGRGAEQRGVPSVELGFAVFGWSMRGRLIVWVADDGRNESRLVRGEGWSDC